MGRGALEAFALEPFALQLAGATDRFRLFPGPAFRGLFVGPPELHLAEDAFTLHLFLKNLEGLIDVVIAYHDLQGES